MPDPLVLQRCLNDYADAATFCRAMTEEYLLADDAGRTEIAVALIAELAARRIANLPNILNNAGAA